MEPDAATQVKFVCQHKYFVGPQYQETRVNDTLSLTHSRDEQPTFLLVETFHTQHRKHTAAKTPC